MATRRSGLLIAVLATFCGLLSNADAQGVGFSASKIAGLVAGGNNLASKPTSLQFGPDNRLYFTQANGVVVACNITRQGPNNYAASNVEIINLVKNIPNYDDDGTRNLTLNTRQATGILVTGTAANPVIYVSSSDPREGAGSGATDLNLDTNSGIISKLTKVAGVWQKLDIVRGFPRSEENHASNGLNFDAAANKIYLAQGGNTNAGSPSNNFAFAAETALCAAILSIDLGAIEVLPVKTDAYGQQYLYDIPTVNDPNASRSHNPDGSDLNDPFGGNDGLNQAKLVEGGPVQVHASGFRNPYDVLIAKTPGKVGKMYTFDNAANSGWGGYPKNEGFVQGTPSSATNEYVTGEPGSVNNQDSLHLISGPGYYGGHPNPIRANPAGAGWFRDNSGMKEFSVSPTTDWPPVPISMADPRQADFRMPGPVSGALVTNTASTTGIAEYTASNFGGVMLGNLITTQYSNASVQRLTMNSDGTQVTGSSILLSGSAYTAPLDVTTPGPGAAPDLAGTIFVAHHNNKITAGVSQGITVLEPTDFDSGGGSVCTGAVSYTLDEDLDGYSNADEILNASDPCSPAVLPPDRDGDFISDLLDTDDDGDGLADTQDSFPIDALNGTNVAPPVRYDFFNELGIGFFNIGFTGVMLNPGEDYLQRINDTDIIAGGTAGLFTDPSVGPGNPHGSSNSQMNAFQVGVNVDEFTGPFRVRSGLGGLLFNGLPTGAQSHGIYIGNGDQDNYLKLAVNANSGPGAIEIVHEENGTILSQVLFNETGLFEGVVTLSFLVDPVAGTVQPGYSIEQGPIINVGLPIPVGGKILDVIRGNGSMAFGLLATTGDAGTPGFNATWDYFEVLPVSGTAAAKLTINSNSGTLLNSSTNTGGSFQVENLSTKGQKITSIKVDLSTALLPDVVFDPFGTAGDVDGKGFDLDSFNGGGIPVGTFEAPHNGVGSEDGYDVLNVAFGPGTSFLPGDLLTFSADIDPTSTKGSEGPGPHHAASVSGLELIGTTVTVTFDDGTVRKIRTAGITGTSNTNKTSVGNLSPNNLPTPDLRVPGKSSPFSTTSQPAVRVSGPPGSEAKIWVFHSTLHIEDLDNPAKTTPNGGYDLDPLETNCVIAYAFATATIGANGFVDVPVTLSHTTEAGGINHVAAVLVDPSGKRSASSNILVINYDPSGTAPTALARVNSGGASYVDGAGQTWSADSGFTSGSISTFLNEIAGTTDDTLYQTFRFDDSPSTPLDYSFAVPNGQYQVKLHFAETWSAITGPGQRVFDVLLEGQLKKDNLDIYAVAGPNTAHVETLQTTVNDGQLTIGFRHEIQNPLVCAIEILALAGGTGPDTEAPSPPDYFATTNLKAGSVSLVWAASFDNVAVTGYRIFRDGQEIGTTAQLTFPDTGLTPSTGYAYEVEAFDAAGNASERSPVTVTTPADQENPTAPGNPKGVAGNQRAILSWTASSDDAGVTGYGISRGGQVIATITGLEYTDNDLTNGTLYTYEIVAFDASGKISAPSTILVRPRALGAAVLRVNVGGPEYLDTLGNTWAADYGFNTGTPSTATVAIAGTEDDLFYQSRRVDNPSGAEMKYTFPLPDGEYELRLHFAEVISTAFTGYRVFDVKVENQLALDNFDIFAQAGYARALSVPIPVTVSGGQITIEFLHVVQNPSVAGIEIFALEAGPPDTTPPTVPGTLATTQITSSGVSLSWTASSDETGVTGYQVRRDGVPVATVDQLTFTDTGLLSQTAYQYTVRAIDAAGNVSADASVGATTLSDTQAPSVPPSLLASGDNGSVALTWGASTDNVGVSGYRVYRDGGLIGTVVTPGFSDSGLTNGTVYVYEVVAFDAANNISSPASTSVTPLVLGASVLRVNAGGGTYVDSFGNTWAADYGFNTGIAEVSSGAVAGTGDPALYQSRRFDNSSGAELKYTYDLPDGNYVVRLHFVEAWSVANAPGIRVFDVKVEDQLALDNFDIFAQAGFATALAVPIPVTVTGGQISIEFIHVVQNPTLAALEIFAVQNGPPDTESPTAPAALAVTGTTAGGISLGWTASTDNVGVTAYQVSRGGSPVATVTQPSFADSGLSAQTLYQYSVVARDAAGNLSAPAIVSATTAADTAPPSMPGALAGVPGNGIAVLSWTASTDDGSVTGYKVRRNGDLITTVTTPGYTDAGLVNGTAYSYQVIAVDAAGNESPPASVSVTPKALGAAYLRVNAGSTVSFVDPRGNTWEPDFGFNASGSNYTEATTNAITGTDMPDLYKKRRIDRATAPELQYQLAVPNGDYEVRLHFAEVWSGAFATGVRVFDVRLENNLALDNLDIFAQVGANKAYVAAVPATVTDGNLTIDFIHVIQNPNVSGIEIFPVLGGGPADTEAPSAPGGLAVSGTTANSIGLSWTASTDNTGVLGYRIYRDSVLVTTAAQLLFTDTLLASGTEYDYSVVAFDAAGNVSAPSLVSGTTLVPDTEAPGTPTDLAAVPALSQVALSWTASTDNVGVNGYQIRRDNVLLTTVAAPGYTDTGLASGVEYDYSIIALDAVGNLSAAALVSATTLPDSESPAAPGDLAATPAMTGISLSWTASSDNSGIAGYSVYRDSVLLGTVTTTGYADGGLVPGIEYDYAVVAVDFAGNLSPPALLSASTLPDANAPSAPGALTGTPGNGTAVLAWTASTDNIAVTGYKVKRNASVIAAVTTLGHTDAGLINGTAYAYEVIAVDAAGNESLPAAVSVTPKALGDALLRVNAGSTVPFIDPRGFTWEPDFGFNASGSNYTEATTNSITGTDMPDLYKKRRIDRATSPELKYQFTVPNGDYEVRLHFAEVWSGAFATGVRMFDVRLENNLALDNLDIFAQVGANKAYVAAVPATVADGALTIDFMHVIQNPNISGIEIFPVLSGAPADTEAPSAPGGLAVSGTTANGIGLSWTASTDNTGVLGYRIYRDNVLVNTATQLSFADTLLAPGTEYDYSVVAFDAAGNVSAPSLVSGTTLAPDLEAPGAPADLAAVPALTQIALSWTASTDNVGVTGYQILRDSVLLTTVAAPGYTDTGLASGMEYNYSIIALDAAGNFSASADLDVTTLADIEAPSQPIGLQTTVGITNVNLIWMPSTDNIAVTGYEIYRNGALAGTVPSPGYADSGLVTGTEYGYQIIARDAAGNSSPAASISAKPREVGPAVARVNAGGLQYTDLAGHVWSADERFNIGSTSTSANAIAGTDDDTLYQTERYTQGVAALEYGFDLPNGQYEVRLHFAETFAGAFNVGSRVFDVRIEGNLAIDNLDIFARAGGNTAYVVGIPATVADGKLNIAFGKEVQNPKICAIEIYQMPAGPGPAFEEWLTTHSLTGQLIVDSDHGSLTNLMEYYLQLDPNDPLDDLAFRPTLTPQAGGILVTYPELKPVGDYFLHASPDITDLANPANRIDTVTKAEIEAMEPASRLNYSMLVPIAEGRMFFQIITDFAND